MKRPSLGCADALIVVDVQVDFCPGGALPVREGDKVVPVLNQWLSAAQKGGATVVATRDWHPVNHVSFQAQGGPWPTHCVQDSRGAAFHADLELPLQTHIVSKGVAPGQQGYSAFMATGLARKLNRGGVKRVWIGGLALDYCVRATALDALKAGFEVHLIKPATRAVNLRRGDGQRTLRELETAGCIIEDGDVHVARRRSTPRHSAVHRSLSVDDGAGVRRRAARSTRGVRAGVSNAAAQSKLRARGRAR